MGELSRRVIVALVGAPVAVAMLWWGDAALATLASALSAVAAWEFYRIARESGSSPLTYVGVAIAALVPLATHAHYLGVVRIPMMVPMLVALLVVAVVLFSRTISQKPLDAAAITILGVIYTGGTLSFAYGLRYFDYAIGDTAGALVVVLPVLLTWSSDVGAFFTGRLIGGPKLMPSVSPGKTISGAVGALVTTTVVCAVFVEFLLKPYAGLAFTTWGLLFFGVSISVVAQLGDLAESLFKRQAGVKDSGTLFPGHGGVLDRLDSIFFVLPVSYALFWLLLIAVPV